MAHCKRTPWGIPDHIQEYAEGITFYGTPSHGGFKLDRARNAAVPEYMRRVGGWYEEDCDWAIVATIHPIAFKDSPKALEDARTTLLNWNPDAYERFYGVELQPGESRTRDERDFYKRHAADLLVVSASGDWHKDVPAGMVGVCASVGGDRNAISNGTLRHFLVPADEYKGWKVAFVVDPARHQEVQTKF